MGAVIKKYLISQLIDFAPCFVPYITLLISIFVSCIDDTGDTGSSLYMSLSPPTTNMNLCDSELSGL